MRISDWSSDACSSDLPQERRRRCPIGGATIRLIIGREPVADAGGRVLERHRLARGCDRESSLLESAIGIIFDGTADHGHNGRCCAWGPAHGAAVPEAVRTILRVEYGADRKSKS